MIHKIFNAFYESGGLTLLLIFLAVVIAIIFPAWKEMSEAKGREAKYHRRIGDQK